MARMKGVRQPKAEPCLVSQISLRSPTLACPRPMPNPLWAPDPQQKSFSTIAEACKMSTSAALSRASKPSSRIESGQVRRLGLAFSLLPGTYILYTAGAHTLLSRHQSLKPSLYTLSTHPNSTNRPLDTTLTSATASPSRDRLDPTCLHVPYTKHISSPWTG
jgi:hypothetical protein